ncbi:PREDICTED: pentatricopeptide repeat-containing protein At4g39530-like [Nelumbo nucifera]|uniref:Pentatricopeptide repeat-containing protein At4g39530 n=2 Tax=Nelumbo nucifera TaxID=4432 RepID=A0A822ZGH2_NELNU|nr:PREDICTED: pentatricopeptide repeat-containing protein At4g39530-like [Nelumbo nucifera]DAD42761.1 TPA_asm: hypothetical protein HUJ06_000991 [Nelumbo nucifera]
MDMLICSSSSPSAKIPLLSHHPTSKLPPASTQPGHCNLRSITTRSNILLSSYSKTKTLDQTLKLFRLLPDRDTVTWNTVIAACSRQGCYMAALQLFVDMIRSSQPPDNLTFRFVLKACAEAENYPLALQIHAFLLKLQGLQLDPIVDTCLVKLFCELGPIEIAREVFDRMPQPDVVAYTAMMVGYTDAGDYEEALNLFRNMIEVERLVPNEFTLTSILSACAGNSSLLEGKQMHAYILKTSLQSNVFVGTALVNLYAKCNRMECAKMALFGISTPMVASWNALMAGNFDGEEVLHFLSMMRESGLNPDHVTFASVLRACKGVGLSSVRQVHGLAVKMIGTIVDVFVGGVLFEIYVSQGYVTDAGKAFECIHSKDILAFNLAIQGYMLNGHKAEAIDLFYEAFQMGMEPNEATLVSLMSKVEGLNLGKQLHGLVVKLGFSAAWCASIASSLIVMYTNFRHLDDAVRVFNKVHSPDLVLWTTIISGFSRSGESEDALKLYTLMLEEELAEIPNNYTYSSVLCSCANLAAVEEGKQIHAQIIKSNYKIGADPFIASSLVDMYAKCGYITEARMIFDKMQVRDLASWNAMITGLAQHGYAEEAIGTFEKLKYLSDIQPNHITFIGVLSACSHSGLLQKGYHYFKLIKEPTIDHYACMVNLLARAGHLKEAMDLVKKMPFHPNEFIWSSLLAASATHGNIELGEHAAERLLQLNPKDPGTYVALSNMYAAARRWENVDKVRKLMEDQGIKKRPGLSSLGVNRMTHIFFAA